MTDPSEAEGQVPERPWDASDAYVDAVADTPALAIARVIAKLGSAE